jgi:hypothetical protein
MKMRYISLYLIGLIILSGCDPIRYTSMTNKSDQEVIMCYKSPAPVYWDGKFCDTVAANDGFGYGSGIGFWSRQQAKQTRASVYELLFISNSDTTVIPKEDFNKHVKVKVRGLFNTHLKITIKD